MDESSRLIDESAVRLQKIYQKFILLTLIEILQTYDLSDEMGRHNLITLFTMLITNISIEENSVRIICALFETLLPVTEERLQFFVDIVRGIVDDHSKITGNSFDLSHPLVNEMLKKNPDLQVKISSIRMDIMELKESEMNAINNRDYQGASKITEDLIVANEKMNRLISSHLDNSSIAVCFKLTFSL